MLRCLLPWYDDHGRDLPWRRPGTTPWAVLVSEVMLQQTPVARVVPTYREWLHRWPTPAHLAAEPAGEAIRGWGRLGYPRRALRLHVTARLLVDRHGGAVPSDLPALLALPGVGDYTARAVASFGFGQRHAVVDTNVRRVLARLLDGAPATRTALGDRRVLAAVLPGEPAVAARLAVALMELGALVCTARRPRCDVCPLRPSCRWAALPAPPVGEAAAGRRQGYLGTDRQARGEILRRLRELPAPLPAEALLDGWPDSVQAGRALRSLLADGLVVRTAGAVSLPD